MIETVVSGPVKIVRLLMFTFVLSMLVVKYLVCVGVYCWSSKSESRLFESFSGKYD